MSLAFAYWPASSVCSLQNIMVLAKCALLFVNMTTIVSKCVVIQLFPFGQNLQNYFLMQ